MRKLVLILYIFIITIFTNKYANSIEYGLVLNNDMDYYQISNSLTNNYEQSIHIPSPSINDIDMQLQQYNKFNEDDNWFDETQLFEYIGMFISKYDSTNKVKIKMKFSSGYHIQSTSIVWRVKF